MFSADVGIAPGLSLAGDLTYFDNQVNDTGAENLGYTGGDEGWMGIARIGVEF